MATSYSKAATALVNGIPMLEISEFEFDGTSNDKAVYTLALGRAGDSDGAEECAVSLQSAIPRNAREKDFLLSCMNHEDVVLSMRMGGVTRTSIGRLSNVKEKGSVNNPNELTASFSGRFIRT